MRRSIILAALLPLVASAALQHTVPAAGEGFIGYPFYPSPITPGMAVSPEFIPGALPVTQYNPRIGTHAVAAMWGTVDAYFQRAIAPYLWRNEYGWDKTVADGIFAGELEAGVEPWVCSWMIKYGHFEPRYFSRDERNFTNDCRRMSAIYTTLTNTVWNDVTGLGSLYDVRTGWTSSRIPDIMFKIGNGGGWGEITGFFNDAARRRYAFSASALDWRDLNTVSDYPGGRRIYRDDWTEGGERSLQRLPVLWNNGGFTIVNDVLNNGQNFECTGSWYQNAAGETVKFSDVLTGVAPGFKVEAGQIRHTPRVYWNQFAFANAYMAALDVQYVDWDASYGYGPLSRRWHDQVTGSEKAVLANANTKVEITVQNNKVVAIGDDIFEGGTVTYTSPVVATNSFTATDLNAGRCLTKEGQFSCIGYFTNTLEKAIIRSFAVEIPADDRNVWNVTASPFPTDFDGMHLRLDSMVGDVYIQASAKMWAPEATFEANVERAGATAIIDGWVVTPEAQVRYLDRPWQEGEGWELYDKYSIRSSRPHPITERWMREMVLNQFDFLVVTTNRTALEWAYGDSYYGLILSDDIYENDGWVKFACDTVKGGSVSGLEQAVLDRQNEIRYDVTDEGGGGLLASGGLNRMKTFNGREAEAVARGFVSELDIGGDNGIDLYLGKVLDFKIQRTGSGEDDTDFIFTFNGESGPIRDIVGGVRWSFSITRNFLLKNHLSRLAISRNFARHLFVFWNFPAMTAGSDGE